MNAKQLAARLHGTDRTDKMRHELVQEAARSGLVILYRVAADDIVGLRGAIDCISMLDDGALYVDAAGVMPAFCQMDRSEEAPMRDWFDRKRLAAKIEVVGNTYRTAIPHESFDMFDCGEPYCRGIIFSTSDLGGAA